MEIVIKHNSIYLKDANLGENFSSMIADLLIDRLGRVKVYTDQKSRKASFYTDLNRLPTEILSFVAEKLGKKEKNRILTKIGKRISSILNNEKERRTTS